MKEKSGLTRREFLATAGVATAGVILQFPTAGSTSSQEPTLTPTPEAPFESHPGYTEAIANLPPQTWKTENGYASPVPISPETLTFSLKDGDLYAETPSGEKLVWIDGSGWAMVQFKTDKGVEFLIDLNFPTNKGREHAAGPQNYIFDGETTDEISDITGDPDIAYLQDNIDWFGEIRNGKENSPLTTDPFDGEETLYNAITTTVAMIRHNTELPTEEQLIDTKKAIEDPYFTIETVAGRWNPNKTRYLVAPFPEGAGWYRGIKGALPENYFTVDKNGKGTLRRTANSLDSWQASMGIVVTLSLIATDAGVQSSYGAQSGISNYPEIYRAVLPLADTNGDGEVDTAVWPIRTGSGSKDAGGYLNYNYNQPKY